jgi:hypothetical protein
MSKKSSLQDRLSAWIDEVRAQAETVAPGPEKDALLEKIAKAEKASELNKWITSPELQSPK